MSNFKFNLSKFYSVKNLVLVLTLSSLGLTGCSKQVECDIQESHAHKYTDETDFVRYLNRENEKHEGYHRTDTYINIEGKEGLFKFLEKNDLLRIEDNLENITSIQENNKPFTEYRYSYTYVKPMTRPAFNGKSMVTTIALIPQFCHSWTQDPTKEGLTGETRECYYVYETYKVVINSSGKYELVKSPQVEDLTTVMGEYPYIKKSFVKIVDSLGEELDYEDGKQEDLTEEEKARIEQYYKENTKEEKKLNKKNLG